DGRTPGKRLMGIRVLMDTGHPLTFTAAAVRNLVRIVDMQPLFTYQVGLAFVLFHAQNKRLGDIVARTVVVRDRPENLQLASVAADPGGAPPGKSPAGGGGPGPRGGTRGVRSRPARAPRRRVPPARPAARAAPRSG